MVLKPEMSIELRRVVRDVLREVMASRTQPVIFAAVETVQITNDHDLAALVTRVTDATTAEKVRSGKLRFTLGRSASSALPASPSELLTGVITEQKIDKLAGAGMLLLGPSAVLTPLARDRARRLGLKIERRR